MSRRILIIEDDASFGVMLQSWFVKNSYEAQWVSKVEQAKHKVNESNFDLIISDLRLPDGDGILFLTWLRENDNMVPVIMMTSYAEVQTAVLAMKLGAADYLKKPVNPSVLQQKIELVLSTAPQNPVQNKPKQRIKPLSIVKGKSKIMTQLYTHLALVAPTKISVLILGESGTGKEYIARMIHDGSERADKPFIAVDCGSLSKELAPSELFGHLKGSFTSAIADKKGVFEQAKGGTVFLDEIGNLPYEVQVQLLRALQEQKVRPVGSASDVSVDVRIIAATNENLELAIVEGRFRQDLYHRINEFSLTVPPLRERIEDLDEFAEHFIIQANMELGKQVKRFSTESMQILKQQYWSGNLRELRNVVRRCVLFAQGDVITPESLPVFSEPLTKPYEVADFTLRSDNEKEQILAALSKARGNKTVAAKLLQIDRKTLYNKMHLLRIEL